MFRRIPACNAGVSRCNVYANLPSKSASSLHPLRMQCIFFPYIFVILLKSNKDMCQEDRIGTSSALAGSRWQIERRFVFRESKAPPSRRWHRKLTQYVAKPVFHANRLDPQPGRAFFCFPINWTRLRRKNRKTNHLQTFASPRT